MPRLADPHLPLRRRAQILEAALYCFRARGFRQTTIEDICGEARISPGALYRYFDTKADIIAAIALDARTPAETAIQRLGDAEGLIDALAQLARAAFEPLSDDGDAALLADIWAEAAHDVALAAALETRNAAAASGLASALTAVGCASPRAAAPAEAPAASPTATAQAALTPVAPTRAPAPAVAAPTRAACAAASDPFCSSAGVGGAHNG